MHEFVFTGTPQKRAARRQDARHRQAADRLRLPPADGLLPAGRRGALMIEPTETETKRDARRASSTRCCRSPARPTTIPSSCAARRTSRRSAASTRPRGAPPGAPAAPLGPRTIDTGDTVELGVHQATLPHNVKSTSANWLDSTARSRPRRSCAVHVHRTGHVHVPVPGPPDQHDRLGHRRGRRARAREGPRLLAHGRLPPRLDPGRHRDAQRGRRGQRLCGHRHGLRCSSPPPTWRSSTSSSSCQPRVTCSTTRSRPPSSATSRPAAATSASTPRRTPSTAGPGTASMLGGYFRNHPAGSRRRPPRRHQRTALHQASRPRGRGSTSGTTSSRRSTRW